MHPTSRSPRIRSATARRHLTIASRKDRFINNRFEGAVRVHYMYTNDSEVSGNVSVGNHVRHAIM
jgi:nitrous oxidase accessory protein